MEKKAGINQRSGFGWVELLKGVAFLLLGVIALLSPQSVISGMIVCLGIITLISGISDIFFHLRLRKHTGTELRVMLFSGIVSSLAGILLILFPVIGKWILSIVFPVWFMAHCISRLAAYDLIRQAAGSFVATIIICLNVLGLIFGLLMIFSPTLFTISVGILISANLIIIGVSSIIEAFGSTGAVC